jgi:hypothetical protein
VSKNTTITSRHAKIVVQVRSVKSSEEGSFSLHDLTLTEAVYLIEINAPEWTSIVLTVYATGGDIEFRGTLYNIVSKR